MKRTLTLYFILILFISMDAFSQNAPPVKARIITTGGTIASKTDAPLMEGHELIRAVPQLTELAEVEVEEYIRIGSSKMTPMIWLDLAKRINAILQETPDLACIIVTHGTDTMEETAFFLNLVHKWDIPVVLVGSMRSSNELSADGPANLLHALRVGISKEASGKGVLVVMNDNIYAGRDLEKRNNRRVDAFPATERGFLGFVDPEKVVFYRSPLKKHTTDSDFDVYELDSLPEVDLLKDFAGMDPAILDYFLARDAEGLIIASFAGGRMSKAGEKVLQLPAGSKPVVIASSIRGGRIMGSHPPGSPLVISNDLPPNKARILLMLALTRTRDALEIQQLFDAY